MLVQNHEKVRLAIEEVFRNAAFREGLAETHGPSEGAGTLLLRLIARLIGSITRWFGELRADSPILFWLLYGLLILVALLLITHIVWSIASGLRGQLRARRASTEVRVPREARFHELRAQARRLAQEGRLREAARGLLLAMLALFEEQRVLAFASGWTNREIFSRLRPEPALAPELGAFARAVEWSSYGGGAPTVAEFQRMDEVVDAVLHARMSRSKERS